MLLALLNICSKEELEESDDETPLPQTPVEDNSERRRVIKNKILAVGRMSRVFALLRSVHCLASTLLLPSDNSMFCREESERVSELKSVSGTAKLPYGTLASGAEGIKDAITNFDDA